MTETAASRYNRLANARSGVLTRAADQQQAMLMQLVEKLGPKGMDILRDQLNPANANAPQAQDQAA